ncbi:LysM domain-containing protein [Colletotrichum sp. SAR 10_96]|nr:LysM domain-containing protein [Colletotrichum sp. SAR 10_96]
MIFLDFKSVALMLLPVALASQSDVWTRATSGGCEAYSVQAGDTCSIIARSVNATYAQIISWNSEIDLTCSYAERLPVFIVRWMVADSYSTIPTTWLSSKAAIVSNPLGNYALPNNSQGVPTIVTTAALTSAAPTSTPAPPSPRAAGEIVDCTAWYAAESGISCAVVLDLNSLTIAQFFAFNPSVKSDCSGMVIGTYYCTSTEPDGSPPLEDDDGQTTPSTTTGTSSPTGIATPSPVQSDMVSNCNKFYKVVSGDGCWAIADTNGIPLEDFYSWNPAVKTDCTGLQADVYVCVGVSASQTLPPATTTTTAAGGSPVTPTPTQEGMVGGCYIFYKVASGDGCWAIADAHGIALDDFYSWNTAVKTDCTGLQADVYVCVGLAAAGAPQPTSSTTAEASAGATPSPVQEGMITNCVKFHLVQSGDGCWAISDARGIALNDFYTWNPAVKTDCSGLQADVYVCVGVA